MPKVTICKGLPASGKSTWAHEQVKRGQGKVARINKDDLRAMVFSGKFSSNLERVVIQLRDTMLLLLLRRGFDVIIDDTNLNPQHERRIREIAGPTNPVEVIFFDVSVEECVKRNEAREGRHKVPEEVIHRMAQEWSSWKHIDASTVKFAEQETVEYIEGLPSAVICDIDGTLAHMVNRKPYDWHKVGDDTLDETIARLVKTLKDAGHTIIILSGRDGVCLKETDVWLEVMGVQYDYFWMRAENDNRKDSIVKRELFDTHIRGKFNVEFVLDDRNQVVDEWRLMGLKCLQVAEGAF